MTMTPKEALVKDGFPVKVGRGRLSREAIDRCKELVAQGWVIRGYEAVKGSPSTVVTPDAPVVVKQAAISNIKEVKEFTIYWPEDAFKAVDASGNEHSMRWCDRNCGVSLVQCLCPEPIIPGDIRVTIKPR